MGFLFLDSSGLVKRYVSEAGTAWVRGVCDPSTDNALFIARITGVETISAITRRVRRGESSLPDASLAITSLRHHLASDYVPVDVTPPLIERAMLLAETHGLRGYDAVQLAAALQVHARSASLGLPDITFLSADSELNAAAIAEGLTVDNPNAHP